MLIKKGFTLIELLIVITIIGVLAVAVLVAINPIEQIRRAQDQGIKSDAAELLKGLERHFTVNFNYPWGATPPNQTLVQPAWITALINSGEVKPEFANRASWSSIYVTQTTARGVQACFDPASITFQNKADAAGKQRDGAGGCTSNCFDCLSQ